MLQPPPAQPGEIPLLPVVGSNFKHHVVSRDVGCVVTGAQDATEVVHLVPVAEKAWFTAQNMSSNNINPDLAGDAALNDISNGIVLSCDLHHMLDARFFAFVPKRGTWVAHFFKPTLQLGPSFPNTPVQFHAEVSPNFLLARLALAVIPLVGPFLTTPDPRTVKVRGPTTHDHDNLEELIPGRSSDHLN